MTRNETMQDTIETPTRQLTDKQILANKYRNRGLIATAMMVILIGLSVFFAGTSLLTALSVTAAVSAVCSLIFVLIFFTAWDDLQ